MRTTVPAPPLNVARPETGWRVPGSLTYRWHGRYFKGAMQQLRAAKRVEADDRNVLTRPERRRAARR